MFPSMPHVSILLVAVLCASILPVSFAQLHFPGANVFDYGDLGFSIVLPLSRNPSNHTLARHEITRLSRVLADGAEPNAKMRLYDDLLTKGYYTSRLWIGSPPQEFALIVDTGSTVTYVPCSSCTQCGTHQDPRFKPENSTTYRPMKCGPGCSSCDTGKQQCTYERRYAEMSTSKGLLGDDLISFGNETTLGPERLVFGCETAETGDIYDQKADGIMGLGRGPLSIVDQLVEQKAMTASFSLCYGGMDEGGGAMIMGAIPHLPEMVFTTSDFTRSAYYNLALQEVFVGGTALPLDKGVFDSNFGTVLDSGTTYAYFPDKAFEAFKTALIQHVKLRKVAGPDSHYPDICFEGAGSDLSKLSDHFPEVQLKFGDGKIISLAPENYLFKHVRVQGAYCLGVFANGKNSATLLGGIVVRNMLVTYDRVNQQIGFWRTNCSDLWRNLQAALVSPGSPVPPPVAAPDGSVEPNVIPGSTCVSGNLDINVVLNTIHSDFNSFKEKFLKDLSDDLKVDRSQVNLLGFVDGGKNVTATFTVHLAATNEHLLQTAAETIIAHLKSEDLPLHDSFGPYVVTSWNLTIIKQRPSIEPRLWVLVSVFALFVFVIIAGIGSLVWWYLWRFRGQKYVSIQESIQMTEQI